MFCARGPHVCRAQFLGIKLKTAESVSNMINLFIRDAMCGENLRESVYD